MILSCVGFAQRELARRPPGPRRRRGDRPRRRPRRRADAPAAGVQPPRGRHARGASTSARSCASLERLLDRTLGERVALRIACGAGPRRRCSPTPRSSSRCSSTSRSTRATRCPTAARCTIAVAGARAAACAITVADTGTGHGAARSRERAFEPFFTTKERGRGHRPRPGDGARHRHRRGRHGRDRLRARPRHRRDDLPAGRGEAMPRRPRSRTRRRSAAPARRERARRRGPGPGPPPGVPDPRGRRLRGPRGGRAATRRSRDWEPVDVLVTDVVMPGMSGQRARRAARASARPACAVVFMSGHTDDVLVRDGARAGDIAFVQKPFTRDSLLRAVEEALERCGRFPTARRCGRRRAGRPAHILDRLSKTLEWSGSGRHDAFQRRALPTSKGNPAVSWCLDPPAPRDSKRLWRRCPPTPAPRALSRAGSRRCSPTPSRTRVRAPVPP